MALGYARLAGESVPGNETNTPTLDTNSFYPPLLEFAATPGFSHLERDDELRNLDEPLSVLVEAADPSWNLESRLYPNLLGALLTYMLGRPTTTAGNGVITDPDSVVIPVGVTRHVWTAPFGPTGSSPLTFQADAAYRDQSTYFKLKGCGVQSLAIETPPSGGAKFTASGPALYMTRGSDPALTATFETITTPPFMRPHLNLSWLGGTADFEDFSIGAEQPLDPVHSGGSGSRWPDKLFKADQPIVWTGSVPKTLVNSTDYDALAAATGFAATAKWISTVNAAASYPFKLFIVMSNCQYTGGGPNPLSNRRRIGASYDFKATRSASASVAVHLMNTTAAYT